MSRFDGERLRAQREAAGLTRKQLALAVNVNHYTLRDYEYYGTPSRRKNPYTPSWTVMERLARTLECQIEDFLAPSEAHEPVGAPADRDEQPLPQHPFSSGDAREGAARSGAEA